MSWVTILWSMAATACLALAAIHFLIWCQRRAAWASLLFSLTATGTTLVAAAAEAGTNDPAFVVKSWRTIDGLPQNSVNAMAQTPDGYLWVGTRGGLARFDGVRFRTYGLADGLKGLSIRALLEDGEGGMWIATRGGGLSHWRKGVISTLTTADGLAHNDVLAFARAEAGGLWVGTSGGLQHLGPDGFKQIGKAEGVRGPVFGMAVSPAEGLWFNQENVGLFHYQDGRCELVEPAPKSRGLFPSSFLVDAEGALWIGMGNGVVLRRHAGEWQEFNQTNGVPFSYIYCLAQGHSGEIWAGSHEAGLYMFREGRFHAIPGTDASIRSVKVSRDGVVWVGTQSGGLSRLAPAWATSHRVGDETRRGQVNGLVENPPGQFWVTTFGGGLFRGTMDRLEPVLGSQELNDLPFLNAGVSMRDGTLFFAGQKGLWRKDTGTGKIRGTILPDNPRALCEGVDGSLWLGTWEGELKRLVEGTPQVVKGGTFPAPVAGLVCGTGPALWVATHGAGLFRWEAGQAQRWTTAEGLPTDILLSLDWDAAGTLWIGTAGGGLAWLEEGRFHSVDARQGLGDSVVSQILEDGQGNLWLGCNRGIMRLSKGELRDVASGKAAAVHPLVLDESDGMLTAECTGGYSPAGLRSQSGTLYFSTLAGVVAVDPAQFGPTPSPPAVLIEEAVLDGKPIATRGGTISLPPGTRELEIHYTAFNYAKPSQIRFRHRLEGGNQDWVEAEGARLVRYSQLPPGDYAFEVSAANHDGRWQEPGARLAFTVLPFFWQTWWFRVLALTSLFGLGGFTTWRLIRRRHQRELQELERNRRHQAELAHVARVSNLGQLASSLAHELNQPLGAILRNAEAAELFLAEPSPDLEELRAILADIRKDDQRAGTVIDRMRALIKRREVQRQRLDLGLLAGEVVALVRPDAELHRVGLELEPSPALPPVQGDQPQLQQVVLNLLLNAMDALGDNPPESRLVTVRVRPVAKTVEVAVSDNGHGIAADKLPRLFEPFFTSKPNGLGMGLAISRSIVEAHGGRLWAENRPGGGATFTFCLPVAGGGNSNQ